MVVSVGSNIYTNTWNTVYKIISGNIIDPATRGGSQWIFSDYPDIQDGKNNTHPRFPIVTIEPFEADTSVITQGIGKTYSLIDTMITVFTTNKRHVDVVSSDIWDAINSNREVLMQSGLSHMEFVGGGVETVEFDRENKIHTKNMGVTFRVEV